mgnify:FL=1
MFEKKQIQCPTCREPMRADIRDGAEIKCRSCQAQFRVLLDENDGQTTFLETNTDRIPEPLFLPRGSIRSAVTVILAVSCWVLIAREKPVPPWHFSLLLTVVGYYFGFRTTTKASNGVFNVTAPPDEPLFLPHGVIRFFLISGFVACGFFSTCKRLFP